MQERLFVKDAHIHPPTCPNGRRHEPMAPDDAFAFPRAGNKCSLWPQGLGSLGTAKNDL